MADQILFARVKQKKATEAAWLANPLILLDGEVAYVVDPTDPAVVTNYKIGVGDKTFAELPYVIHYATDATFQAVKKYIGVSANQIITGIFKAGTLLNKIPFINTAAASLVIRIGTTNGGAEIAEFTFSSAGKLMDLNYLFESTQTVYITGITGLCTFFVDYTPYTDSPAILTPPTLPFRYPKGHFGFFYVLYAGHLEENFDLGTGFGLADTAFENCQLTGNGDLVNFTGAYIAGIAPSGTPQALTGNTGNQIVLDVGSMPPHTHSTTRTRTDAVGTIYESNHINGGSSRGLWTGDTVQTGSAGGTNPVDIRPRTITMYSFVAITD